MKGSAFVLMSCFFVGCASAPSRVDSDVVSIAKQFVSSRSGIAAFVVSPEFDARTRNALALIRPVVSPEAVPKSEKVTLPEGYFLLKTLRLNGDDAEIAGTLGPLYVPHPREFFGCGVTYRISFHRQGGTWREGIGQQVVC